MSTSIRILLPTLLKENKERQHDNISFKGVISVIDNGAIVIYITEFIKNGYLSAAYEETDNNTIYGHIASRESGRKTKMKYKHFLEVKDHTDLSVAKLIINGKNVTDHNSYIIILYDLQTFKKSETVSDSLDYFAELKKILMESSSSKPSLYSPVMEIPSWFSSSMFIQHILNYFNLLVWLTKGTRDKNISIKIGNLILAIITDVFLGYIMLQCMTKTDKKVLGEQIMGIVEKMVNYLYSLLKWLMGSPAGLKLNNAFNQMLGNYFAYHIHLWWLFLDVSGARFHKILEVYQYLGYLGLTFQAAIISDMICVATFHSYCIYVYAARLFNIQISGLIALLRLFVGRKYNPLRNCIDSCEYTNQELFVGTVAFTILLLLLPTTTMYYIVFTLFRLLSLGMQYLLAKLIYTIQSLPLYVLFLWITQSPKVAGNILLVPEKNEDRLLVLRVKLYSKSVKELVEMFLPPIEMPKKFGWANALSNIFRGKQIL